MLSVKIVYVRNIFRFHGSWGSNDVEILFVWKILELNEFIHGHVLWFRNESNIETLLDVQGSVEVLTLCRWCWHSCSTTEQTTLHFSTASNNSLHLVHKNMSQFLLSQLFVNAHKLDMRRLQQSLIYLHFNWCCSNEAEEFG